MRYGRYILSSVALVVMGICLWWSSSELRTAKAVSSRQAFTIVQITEAFGENGLQNLSETKVTAQNADGSQAFQVTRSFRKGAVGYDSVEFRNVFDVVSGRHYGIDPLTRSLTTRVLKQPRLNDMTSKPRCDGGTPDSRILFGFQTRKRIETRKLSGSQNVTIEEWQVPELECFSLEVVANKFESGRILARTTTRAVLVNVGDPDPGLFHIPTDYVERSPSQVMSEHTRMGRTEFNSALAQAADRSYHENQ